MQHIKIFFAALASIILLSGCSISTSIGTSSESSSDSSSSICKSSTSSDESAIVENRQDYQQDVAAFTDTAAHSGISPDEFMQGLGRIAERHGITAWDMREDTYRAIGMGLKTAKIKKEEIPEEPFLKELVQHRDGAMQHIMAGYEGRNNL